MSEIHPEMCTEGPSLLDKHMDSPDRGKGNIWP